MSTATYTYRGNARARWIVGIGVGLALLIYLIARSISIDHSQYWQQGYNYSHVRPASIRGGESPANFCIGYNNGYNDGSQYLIGSAAMTQSQQQQWVQGCIAGFGG